ncbi:MAG: DUF4384 domain-containing protein, partial [Pseudomonadales bacterium]
MRTAVFLLILTILSPIAHGAQSSITEADGESCMGDDKSRRQTERVALESAKRLAVEFSSTHISSTTIVENFELKNDIVEAFNKAEVKVLDVLNEKWDDPQVSDCYTIRIKAEVLPSQEVMQKVDNTQMMSDPRLPLAVNLWVNSSSATYTEGESMKIYLQGNKPFYARLIYVDSQGNNVQLLPNQHRRDNYFAGATMFEVPTGQDQFELKVSPPFGKEKLVLYASTMPLGQVSTEAAGPDLYLVTDQAQAIGVKTRGIAIKSKNTDTA